MGIIKTVHAQIVVNLPNDPLQNKFQSAKDVLAIPINIVFWVVIAITTSYLIISALKLSASGGDKFALQAAKKSILYAVIGYIMAIAFRAIVQVILNITVGTSNGLPNVLPDF